MTASGATKAGEGRVDFKVKYLNGVTERWKYRRDVAISAGDTVQVTLP